MKVVLAFDSYKGSLTSKQAGEAAARAIRKVRPDAQCDVVPLADGGEGTVAAVVEAANGSFHEVAVTGPMGAEVMTQVGLLSTEPEQGRTAVLEAASICGITMIAQHELDPLAATSRGIGEAMLRLLDEGIRSFVIGLGGSATNDGGMGMLAALGASFYDAKGLPLRGCGGDLLRLDKVVMTGLDARIQDCFIRIATDVDNPLCGERGATMIYGRQKGATPGQQAELDRAMAQYAEKLEASAGGAWQQTPGSGAAGGLGFALLVLGGEIVPGAHWLMKASGLQERIHEADWVMTGEGRSDAQTLFGKLPAQVGEAARSAGKPCILLSGSLGGELGELEQLFSGCFSIVREPAALEQCMEQAEVLLEQTAGQIFRLIGGARQRGGSAAL